MTSVVRNKTRTVSLAVGRSGGHDRGYVPVIGARMQDAMATLLILTAG